MTRPHYPSDDKPRARKPGGAGPDSVQVTVILPLELEARLDSRAKAMGVSVAAVVREAVVGYLEVQQVDHAPDGWPAVQMRDVSALLDEIADLRARLEPAPPPPPVTCRCEACDLAADGLVPGVRRQAVRAGAAS